MILSCSRRTDIPSFYGEWFMNRLREGFVYTRNPFNNTQLSRITLSPDIIDCIVFWTKDAKNIMPYLVEIDRMDYKYCFQFTLTPYGNDLETNLCSKNEIIETFKSLSSYIGKEKVFWRYDPIILNDSISVSWHIEHFQKLCEALSAYTESVTISFVDNYSKLKTPLIRNITDEEMFVLAEYIRKTSKEYGLQAKICCEKTDFSKFGIQKAACIDKAAIEKICGYKLEVPSDRNQREGCGCAESIDIGSYNSCINGCIYCYANNGTETVRKRFESHDPKSALLVGSVREGEKITERVVRSNRQNQTELF